MNETKRYLDHLTRTTADNVTATVKERNDDGTYMVETVGSKALRIAGKANPFDEFALGSRVIISEVSASRNVVGAQPVIISRAPREQRGLSATTPQQDREYFDRASITSVDPDPLILTAGGAAAEQTITGHGFTAAASYFARGDAPDPELTETVAADVSDTEVVMTISADAGSPLGDFHVTINGAVASTALRIVAARRIQTLWYWRADGSELLSVNKTTGAIIAAWANPGGASTYRPLIADATYVYAFTSTHLLRVRMATGVAETFVLDHAANFHGTAAVVSGVLWYSEADPAVDTARRIVRYDPLTMASTFELLGSASGKFRPIFSSVGAVLYGTILDITDIPFLGVPFSFDTATSAESFAGSAIGDEPSNVAVTESDILTWALNAGVVSVYRYDRSSLNANGSVGIAGSYADVYALASGSLMYVSSTEDVAGARLIVIDGDTLTVQYVALPDITHASGIALDSTLAYIGSENEDVVQTVNRSTLAASNFAAPAAVGVLILA